jgi:hypothetical protein
VLQFHNDHYQLLLVVTVKKVHEVIYGKHQTLKMKLIYKIILTKKITVIPLILLHLNFQVICQIVLFHIPIDRLELTIMNMLPLIMTKIETPMILRLRTTTQND